MRYDHKKIEEKWRKRWLKERIYEPDLKKAKKPFYNLMMFPYPSAEGLHIGAVRTFTGVDIYGRFKRMRGYDVFEPIGLDGFGIHSENYALKVGKHPIQHAKDSEKNFYRQLAEMGNGFAWDERLETYDPDYYKWTQWIFVQMFKRGLAYRKKAAVNWCPSCLTVLADEQVIQKTQSTELKAQSVCERCETPVIKKELEQWFFKITNYAERLLKNLENLPDRQAGIDWSKRIKIAQKNWIGRSEGALIDFEVAGSAAPSYVLLHGYTGSPDKNFFPWLKRELEKRGAKVYAPELPGTNDPRVYEQVAKVFKSAPFDENTVLVGHSLGGVVAMKILEQLKKPIKKTILVASFTQNRFLDEPFRAYTFDWRFDAKTIKQNAGSIHILRDTTDDTVPQYQADNIKNLIGGNIFDFAANGFHATGETEPEVLRHCIDSLRVFTTRPDTLFGATYMVLGPEHPLITEYKTQITNYKGVEEYIRRAKSKSDEERIAESKEKSGVELRGLKAINPANKEEIPVWVADYVLGDVGTGAIMAVPAHDQRDYEFAQKFNLPIKMVVCPHYPAATCPVLDNAYAGEGHLVDSGKFNGMPSEIAKWEIAEFVGGKKEIQYRLRDWLISRQRYWGPPIPMIYCEKCALRHGSGQGWQPVPEKDLPVKLPYIKNFRPTGTEKSPLATVEKFYKVKCPKCKSWARRETDVSDAFLDSAWYYLRYPSVGTQNSKVKMQNDNSKFKITEIPWNDGVTKKWLPVNMYIGGAEHSVLHLLYSRFLTMAFRDWGLLGFEEPFTTFRAHGLITKDGAKMSKSKGNVVSPDEYFRVYGSDAMRMYLAFLAPLSESGDFRDSGISGITRFLSRIWNGSISLTIPSPWFDPAHHPEHVEGSKDFDNSKPSKKNIDIDRAVHKTIKKVSEDIENLQYNTAISALMILLNDFEKNPSAVKKEHMKVFLKLLAPFAPYISEELWMKTGEKSSIHKAEWPEYDPKFLEEENVTIIIQVNGKVRDKFEMRKDMPEDEVRRAVLSREKVKKTLRPEEIKKFIYVKNKLANIVI